ncbi:polysaccharide deacetylase family protein [Simiduia sp. 21SJ11W-1]|uniref:polysaccharide deacetylase family protein n=1 Tax=Simiduia sp. 21SJ11W-1 TaxID=2909669 RepID=UPI00209C8ED8|nr:polysaccharide deacetylase family protein [Simiduia sp. 21SJ11W-1]UTA48937.1 polysaccharide deacetylase family protein [Simiduia sp. 21SJ11W-1]
MAPLRRFSLPGSPRSRIFWGLSLLLLSPLINAQPHWPDDGRTAVSLNYDDALPSQLDHALPALNSTGLRATFYLTLASPVIQERLDEWRALAAQGHALGNHSVFHHCRASLPGRDWVQPHQDLDQRSPRQMLEELQAANSFLTAIDGQQLRTYTPPCGDTHAGGQPYLPLVAPLFTAILSQEPPALNATWLSPSGVSGEALIAQVKTASAHSRLINITFHGIGGDHLAISAQAHQALLNYLAQHPEKFFVATYQQIAKNF